MVVTEGQIVTIEARGERAEYVVTDIHDSLRYDDGFLNPLEIKLLRLADQPAPQVAPDVEAA